MALRFESVDKSFNFTLCSLEMYYYGIINNILWTYEEENYSANT